ncbi:MAG: sugar phosphate isomerase/epimerase [Candidatus Omnitrophica bacterium]|nr:sugar phosphate isomerase/epimerase [Candidatus Omnitrophota bacterium]
MSLALSTAWNASRYEEAEPMLFEIKDLGFRDLELSFNLTASMVEGIRKARKRAGLQIISLHNYCPIPDGFSRKDALPDCYSLASLDEDERRLALNYARRTIDTAASLGAGAVVLHCGRVEIPDKTRSLAGLYENGAGGTKAFLDLRDAHIKERKETAAPFLKNALKSLEELNRHAAGPGVRLGVETRFYYREIPSFEEIGIILKELANSQVFYWHDTGHAQLMENLGFSGHKDFLDLYAGQMLGIHLHDILGANDHRAPLKGELDFAQLKPYVKKDTLKVMEPHHPATPDEIRSGKEYLEEIFGAGN